MVRIDATVYGVCESLQDQGSRSEQYRCTVMYHCVLQLAKKRIEFSCNSEMNVA